MSGNLQLEKGMNTAEVAYLTKCNGYHVSLLCQKNLHEIAERFQQ